MTQSRTKIYFAIKTEDQNVSKSVIAQYLSLHPTKFELMFARGNVPKCTVWEYGNPEFTNRDIELELDKLISPLSSNANGLKRLKNDWDVRYVLQFVLYIGEVAPGLHFSQKVTKFLSEIDAEIDCDLYNYK